ncbi:glycine/betaine ABC transporter substrate-binding protein, partial [Mycobacterium tuberculosis]|nr:glycine/betaine ABC transporter substrate-binding protein [Mycobacterium tuberculosis]
AWAAPKVIVGSADFPESQLLGTIYAGALEAQNIPVEKKLNIGSREVYIPALLDGSLSLRE